jgi:hypothetical protein
MRLQSSAVTLVWLAAAGLALAAACLDPNISDEEPTSLHVDAASSDAGAPGAASTSASPEPERTRPVPVAPR